MSDNFYSHISARCDDLTLSCFNRLDISTLTSLRDVTLILVPLRRQDQISTLTSLRDVTYSDITPVGPQDNFYSHISARCDRYI